MKTTIGELKNLIKENAKGTFFAATYDEESQGYHPFFRGPRQECEKRAQRMAKLLETPYEDEPVDTDVFFADDEGNVHGMCRVIASGDERLITNSPFVVTIEQTTHNAYQERSPDQNIKVNWPAAGDFEVEKDDPGFVPVKPSKFKAGDTVILPMAVYNNPGGMIVVDMNITRREYWQANTFE